MKKKKCTNSSCRREFSAERRACPYCGSVYPRLIPSHGKLRSVFLIERLNNFNTVFELRRFYARQFGENEGLAMIVEHARSKGFDKDRHYNGKWVLALQFLLNNGPMAVTPPLPTKVAKELKANLEKSGATAILI